MTYIELENEQLKKQVENLRYALKATAGYNYNIVYRGIPAEEDHAEYVIKKITEMIPAQIEGNLGGRLELLKELDRSLMHIMQLETILRNHNIYYNPFDSRTFK